MSFRKLIVIAGIALLGWVQIYPVVHQMYHADHLEQHANTGHGHAEHHSTVPHSSEAHASETIQIAIKPIQLDAHDCPLCLIMPAGRYIAPAENGSLVHTFAITCWPIRSVQSYSQFSVGLPAARAPPLYT